MMQRRVRTAINAHWLAILNISGDAAQNSRGQVDRWPDGTDRVSHNRHHRRPQFGRFSLPGQVPQVAGRQDAQPAQCTTASEKRDPPFGLCPSKVEHDGGVVARWGNAACGADGRQINQSFSDLVNTEILALRGSGRDYEIGFKYERFYDFFVGQRLCKLVNTPPQRPDEDKLEAYAELGKEASAEAIFLWGALKDAFRQAELVEFDFRQGDPVQVRATILQPVGNLDDGSEIIAAQEALEETLGQPVELAVDPVTKRFPLASTSTPVACSVPGPPM